MRFVQVLIRETERINLNFQNFDFQLVQKYDFHVKFLYFYIGWDVNGFYVILYQVPFTHNYSLCGKLYNAGFSVLPKNTDSWVDKVGSLFYIKYMLFK